MKLTLIRHSKTILEKDKPNLLWQLSEEGIHLATELAKSEHIKTITTLYSSFQTKALQTALILAKDNYIPIRPDNRLTELTSITNGWFDNYEQTMHDFYTGKIERINGGERISEGRMRINQAIEEITKQHKPEDNIGIVAHGNILSILSAQYCNKTELELHSLIQMPDIAVLDWETKQFSTFYGEIK